MLLCWCPNCIFESTGFAHCNYLLGMMTKCLGHAVETCFGSAIFVFTRFCYANFTDDADNTITVVKKATKGRAAKKTAAATPTPVGPEDVCSAVKPATKRATVRGKVSSLAKLTPIEINEGSDEAAAEAEAEAKPAGRVSVIFGATLAL